MDNTAYNITKSIGYTENGGKPNIKNPSAGKTGEMASIFQYEPSTWSAYSSQITGKKNMPLTPDNEVAVTQAKIQQWLDEGMTPQQCFSAWNAGPGESNAYTGKFSDGQSSVGVNAKYGVKYDVPGYVDKAMNYFNEFNNGQSNQQSSQPTQQNQTPSVMPSVSPTASPQNQPPQVPQSKLALSPQPKQSSMARIPGLMPSKG